MAHRSLGYPLGLMDAHSRVHDREINALARVCTELFHIVHELAEPFAVPGRGSHYRDAKKLAELLQVDFNAPAPGLVQKVYADDQIWSELQHLQYQIQIALKAGCIADGYSTVRAAGGEEIPGGLFFRGMGLEGVAAGEVNEDVAFILVGAVALGIGDCLAGPISCM